MENKITVLLIVILIIGFAGGFILSYVVYQPQIHALTDDVSALEEENQALETENDELLSDLLDALSKINPSNNNSNSSGTEQPNGTDTDHELLEITDVQVTTNGTHFEVDFTLENSGTINSAIIAMSINEEPIQNLLDVTALVFNGTTVSAGDSFSFPIPIGAYADFTMILQKGVTTGLNLQSGDSVALLLTSSQLNEYPMSFNLP